ncbi:MAG: hypothetical protein QW728_01255 [Thermoplasmata archaeon]
MKRAATQSKRKEVFYLSVAAVMLILITFFPVEKIPLTAGYEKSGSRETARTRQPGCYGNNYTACHDALAELSYGCTCHGEYPSPEHQINLSSEPTEAYPGNTTFKLKVNPLSEPLLANITIGLSITSSEIEVSQIFWQNVYGGTVFITLTVPEVNIPTNKSLTVSVLLADGDNTCRNDSWEVFIINLTAVPYPLDIRPEITEVCPLNISSGEEGAELKENATVKVAVIAEGKIKERNFTNIELLLLLDSLPLSIINISSTDPNWNKTVSGTSGEYRKVLLCNVSFSPVPGKHNITAMADFRNIIYEADESNNAYSLEVEFVPIVKASGENNSATCWIIASTSALSVSLLVILWAIRERIKNSISKGKTKEK